MKLTQSTTDYLLIEDYDGLDPVHVWMQDDGKGAGRIVILCYGCALNAYWGSMGMSLKEFFISASNGYIAPIFANNIEHSYCADAYDWKWNDEGDPYRHRIDADVEMSDSQYNYICRIIDCVREAFTQQLNESKQND